MSGSQSPLIPHEDAREAALFFVVCALCFLAVLAALMAKSTYGAARSWTAEVQGELTVSLLDIDARAAEQAIEVIAATDGVATTSLMSKAEIDALLAPNFGQRGLPSDLPLPQIVTVTAAPDDVDVGPNIKRRLTEAGYSAVVDEHTDWERDVQRVLSIGRWVAILAVALLAATAVGVIAFATHAALLARREIVEVLHLSGADDRFISKLFERRFWVLGLRAGTVGALIALGAVALTILFLQTNSERAGLLPQLSLDFFDLLILVMTPILAGLAARAATRLTVMQNLKQLV